MATLRLDGTRIIVTGASRGLGRVLAEEFVRAGARVVGTARTAGHLDALARGCAAGPGSLEAVLAVDVGDPESVAAAATAARAALGRVDVLVNNAGILGARVPLTAIGADDLADAFAVNVLGPLGFVRGLLDAFADDAVIINVTSGAAGRAGWGAYGLTKAALNTMTAMLADELAPRRVRCVAINPGGVRTDMRRAAYPDEDPATVPHPRSVSEAFVAIAAGAPATGLVEARTWTR